MRWSERRDVLRNEPSPPKAAILPGHMPAHVGYLATYVPAPVCGCTQYQLAERLRTMAKADLQTVKTLPSRTDLGDYWRTQKVGIKGPLPTGKDLRAARTTWQKAVESMQGA